jgi:hypothetical protein
VTNQFNAPARFDVPAAAYRRPKLFSLQNPYDPGMLVPHTPAEKQASAGDGLYREAIFAAGYACVRARARESSLGMATQCLNMNNKFIYFVRTG